MVTRPKNLVKMLFLYRNKSKMIESRLIEQRARLVMIVKQGVVPEELENEKIVEMQLQKRQVRRIVIIICDNVDVIVFRC